MRSVLITGTSTGIGLETALELARRGWRVIATMRNLERQGLLDRAIGQAGLAENVSIVRLDVTDQASIDAAVAATLAEIGQKLDAVVHNAGVAAAGAMEDIPEADLRRVMDTNFFGVLALTRALLPTFRAQRRGRILIVTSEAAFVGQPLNSIYVASKWAIEGWAESVAYEFETFGIDTVLVEPGPYKTEIWHGTPRFQPPDSPYRRWVTRVFHAGDAHFERLARDPKEVALKIAGVLEARRPGFRHPVGPMSRLNHFLRGKLPSRLLRRATKRYLGILNFR
jgi:NAD(P)-dependent dehydrogenase (short-subunit alcohol dehydrogenase family)